MKLTNLLKFIAFSIILSSCFSKNVKVQYSLDTNNESMNKEKINESSEKTDTVQLKNDCENEYYQAVLHENMFLDSNRYTLTINLKNKDTAIVYRLDMRPRAAKINYCTRDYINLGFAAGGPIWIRLFVFLDPKKETKVFMCCKAVENTDNIIIYYKTVHIF